MTERASHNADGSLRPMMLSELIQLAQNALKVRGDMHVWISATVRTYDDTTVENAPAESVMVDESYLPGTYWKDSGKLAFVLVGN